MVRLPLPISLLSALVLLPACGDGPSPRTHTDASSPLPDFAVDAAIDASPDFTPPHNPIDAGMHDASGTAVDAEAEHADAADAEAEHADAADAEVPADAAATCSAAEEVRVRFASASVAAGQTCTPEEQKRRCVNGHWGDWSGQFEEPACEVLGPPCDSARDGTQQQREAYKTQWVSAGESCARQNQTRTCRNGQWSEWNGDFKETWCLVCSTPLDACGMCGGPGPVKMYEDQDGDGFGDPEKTVDVCQGDATQGLVRDGSDATPRCFTLRGGTISTMTAPRILGAVCEVEGDLEIAGSGAGQSITLPALERISGKLNVQATNLTSLKLPVLAEIGSDVTFGICGESSCAGPSLLSDLDFRALTHVGGKLAVHILPREVGAFMPALTEVDSLSWDRDAPKALGPALLPKLVTIHHDLAVSAAELVNLPALETAGEISIAAVTSVRFPKLKMFASLNLSSTQLSEFDCATVMPSAAVMPSLRFYANSKLTSVSCNLLTRVGTFFFGQNTLASVQLDGVVQLDELHITGSALSELKLNTLVKVGRFSLNAGPLSSLELPLLETAESIRLDFSVIGLLSFPKLRQVGSIGGYGGTGLGPSAIELPALEAVSGDLDFHQLEETTRFSAPLLRTVGGRLRLELHAAFNALDLRMLESVGGDFSITFAYKLPSLALPSLTTIGGEFSVSWMASMTDLSVPKLTHAQRLQFNMNSSYPQCRIDALAAKLGVECLGCSENGNGSCSN